MVQENVEQNNISKFTYSGHILRNFTANFLDQYIGSFWPSPKEYRSAKSKIFETNSFITISQLLEDVIKDTTNKQLIDTTLFNELAWILPDNHFLFRFKSTKSQSQIVNAINKKTGTLDKPIYHISNLSNRDELQIVSVREKKDSLIILFRNGYTVNEDDKKTLFFISCEFNFKRETFIIKMRETHRKNSKIPKRLVIEKIINFIQKHIIDLNIEIKTDTAVKGKIYEMFTNESDNAEAIITKKLPIKLGNLENMIQEFVKKNLNLNDIDSFQSNCKIIKSMYYQNIAKGIDSSAFHNRHIFAFSFFDGTTTKSITRDAKRNHIYGKDLYWSLKSIVHKETKVDEISIYYKINKQDYKIPAIGTNFLGLEVTIREFFGSFMIDFYNTNRRDPERRIKSEFITYELDKYL